MTDAPERIVVAYYDDAEQSIRWEDGPEWMGETEYVRADLFAALEAERDRLREVGAAYVDLVKIEAVTIDDVGAEAAGKRRDARRRLTRAKNAALEGGDR
jgi:hypothetical protein